MTITRAFIPRQIRVPGDLQSLCQQFIGSLAWRQYSPNTRSNYQAHLEQFVGYLAARDVTLIQCVTDQHVADWMQALVEGEGNAPRTVACKLETVRSLYRFAATKHLVAADNPAARAVAPRWHAKPPNAPAKEALLAMIESIPVDNVLSLRDRVMFRLMLDSALRIDGLCSLDVYDPLQPPTHCVHPNGRVRYRAKGGATKETVVDDTTAAMVAAWTDAREQIRQAQKTPALFVTERGNRMNRQAMHARIKLWGAAAGMPHLHAHLLRHCRARDVIDTAGTATAQFMLGHARPSTTADMYGEHSAEILRQRARTIAPLDAKKGAA